MVRMSACPSVEAEEMVAGEWGGGQCDQGKGWGPAAGTP